MSYLLISDTHQHAWQAFSTTLKDGTNSRNQIILDETYRHAKEAHENWGIVNLVHAGDLFHVRGSVAPSVLNATLETYRRIVDDFGMRIYILAGNHDMEARESGVMTNSVQAMASDAITPLNKSSGLSLHDEFGKITGVIAIPWFSTVAALKAEIESVWASLSIPGKVKAPHDYDLILHAPLNGVITGLPDHGLDPEWLAGLGFKRVFCGHYHNHKAFEGGVCSIGALTHQTWGDVGSKAGALIVLDESVEWRASQAPEFIELDPTMDPDEMAMQVDGNYVRARVEIETRSDLERLREELTALGAAGVSIIPISKTTVTVRGSSVKSGASIADSIGEFIRKRGYTRATELGAACASILARTEEVA